jgi:hypothetical protein
MTRCQPIPTAALARNVVAVDVLADLRVMLELGRFAEPTCRQEKGLV